MGKKILQDQSEQPEHLLKYIAEAGDIDHLVYCFPSMQSLGLDP